jgi:uncharacterized protein YhaN
MHVDHEDCARRAHIIESLRSLAPRVDAARRVYTAGLERRDAVAQEKRVLSAGLVNVVPPSPLAFGLFVALIWIAVTGLVIAELEYVGAGVGTVSVLAMFWYRDRLKRASTQKKQVAECSSRLGSCESELRKTETEAREIEAEIRRLTGKDEIIEADINERIAELDRLLKINDDARALDEAIGRYELDLIRIAQQIGEIDASIAALLSEGSATTAQEFLARSEIYKQRQQLLNELDKIPVETADRPCSSTCAPTKMPPSKPRRPSFPNSNSDCLQVRHETAALKSGSR